MAVKDDEHPLPYQDHQRRNNGSRGSQKKMQPIQVAHTALMLSALLPLSPVTSILRAAAFIIPGPILFAIVDLICAH